MRAQDHCAVVSVKEAFSGVRVESRERGREVAASRLTPNPHMANRYVGV